MRKMDIVDVIVVSGLGLWATFVVVVDVAAWSVFLPTPGWALVLAIALVLQAAGWRKWATDWPHQIRQWLADRRSR